MGDTVVVYESTVSAIVEAAKVYSKDFVYAQLNGETLKVVEKTADRIILVVEHVSPLVSRALASDKVKLVVAKKRWYAGYVFKHLVEPRVKDVLANQSIDEYSLVLLAEYKTIELCRKALATIIPRKVGDFAFAVVPRIPTGDTAVLYYEKYRAPVLVASMRDAGVAWSAIADKDALNALANRFVKIGYVDFKSSPFLSGFIPTYPESPRAYLAVIEEVLESVQAKPPASMNPPKTCTAVSTTTTFYDYLVFKARCVSRSSAKTMIDGKTYTVVNCGQNSPYYVSSVSSNSCTVMFYLPPPSRLVVATPFTPNELRTDQVSVKVSPVTSTPDSKYITVVPGNIVGALRNMLKRYGRAVLSVS